MTVVCDDNDGGGGDSAGNDCDKDGDEAII